MVDQVSNIIILMIIFILLLAGNGTIQSIPSTSTQ